MWPVTIFLMIVVAFYWAMFCVTVVAFLKAISHLCFGNFTRAAACPRRISGPTVN
jgi:hypothetical protein